MSEKCIKDPPLRITVEEEYLPLAKILIEALDQAQYGKGNIRHNVHDEPFLEQPIFEIASRVGPGYHLGQAVKKIYESLNTKGDCAVQDLLGAINYIAARIIVIRSQLHKQQQTLTIIEEADPISRNLFNIPETNKR